ncbi:MAG: glycosyl transferase [Candidatus Rokuibacteriota bacterium]|nr:MAG: glycosyl transferase [Candidatus Rokubacteria bacterium]
MRRARPRGATLALLTVAAVGPVLYPVWLALRTRRLPDPVPPEPREWPPLTVVIPAYRERAVIVDKIQNTLDNGYPGPLEVVVVAEDAETSSAARATAAHVVADTGRRGKAGALNLGLAESDTPIVVLTDANTTLQPGALAKLVRWFDEPSIGAVAGEKRIAGQNGDHAYWSFESWLKRREWRTGTTIGIGGEIVALRRMDFRSLPEDVVVDDLWIAMDLSERGRRVAYDPEVSTYEEPSPDLGTEWERRTRVVAGTIDAIWRRRGLLVPGTNPVAGQLWGHRLVRSSLGPLAHALLLPVALRSARHSLLARAFLGVHAFASISLLRRARGAELEGAAAVTAQVLFLQAVGVGGTLRWARGDRPALWPKPEREQHTSARDGEGAEVRRV